VGRVTYLSRIKNGGVMTTIPKFFLKVMTHNSAAKRGSVCRRDVTADKIVEFV